MSYGSMPDITLNRFVPEREEETKKLQDGLDSLEFRFKCWNAKEKLITLTLQGIF